MDITEFLQQSAGKWVSQRTSHPFAFKQTGSSKSNIVVEMLPKDDPTVVKLCQQHKVDPTQALCGTRVTWDSIAERGEQKRSGSTLMVPIADPDNSRAGTLLCEAGQKSPISGRYTMGEDDALTLITESEITGSEIIGSEIIGSETLRSEERLWFASPNLRLRTSTLKRSGGVSMATFSSEIRMGGVQPPSSSTASEGN